MGKIPKCDGCGFSDGYDDLRGVGCAKGCDRVYYEREEKMEKKEFIVVAKRKLLPFFKRRLDNEGIGIRKEAVKPYGESTLCELSLSDDVGIENGKEYKVTVEEVR